MNQNFPLIYLIGPRGSGKTAVARLLAERLGWSWLDADLVLEERAGRSIRQIFAEEGEESFRAREGEILAELSQARNVVVATGGGVVLRAENRDRLRTGMVIWLTATPEVLYARLQADAGSLERRPPLAQGGLEEVRDIVVRRTELYAQCADVIVDTSLLGPAEVLEMIWKHQLIADSGF